jgi:hypothetical protein
MRALAIWVLVLGAAWLFWPSSPNPMADYVGVSAAGVITRWPYSLTGKDVPTNPSGYWNWTVFDRSDAGKMLITFPMFNPLQANFAPGAKEYSDAAEQFLHKTKRENCQVQKPDPVNPYFVEVKYSCSKG